MLEPFPNDFQRFTRDLLFQQLKDLPARRSPIPHPPPQYLTETVLPVFFISLSTSTQLRAELK